MKRSGLMLLLLPLTLALVVALLRETRSSRETTAETQPEAMHLPPGEAAESGEAAHAGAPAANFHWRQLEAEDYRTYIERLRSIGCPEQTIRDIIIADIDKLLAPRLHAAIPRREELNYWEPEEQELWNNFDHRELLREQREVDFEKRELLRELLGVDLVGERLSLLGQEDFYGRRLGFLSEEKRSQVRMILDKYQDAELALREKEWEEGEPLTAEDRAELLQIRQARRAELAATLGPAEQELFDLWLSPTANAVRDSIYGMNATEEEFQTLYRLRQQFDEAWNPDYLDLSDPSTRENLERARGELDERIRESLGEERYADYQRGQDPDFRQVNVTAARFKLPAQVAHDIYQFKAVVQSEREKVLTNTFFTSEQKQEILAAMAEETERAVKEVLGDRPFNYYKRNGHTGWMTQ